MFLAKRGYQDMLSYFVFLKGDSFSVFARKPYNCRKMRRDDREIKKGETEKSQRDS